MSSFFDRMYEPPVPLGEPYPLFNRISIETCSFCNRKCPFCPVSTGRRDREATGGLRDMDIRLVAKLSIELEQLGFDGVIQLFLLNEPLLDPRLTSIAGELRAALPKATIYVSTNGDPLGRNLEKALIKLETIYEAGINVINLNVYDAGEEQREYYHRIKIEAEGRLGVEETRNKYRKHPVKRRFLAVTDMSPERIEKDASLTDSFHLRGMGDRPAAVPQRYCARPQRHLVVLYDGSVPICCAVDPTDAALPKLGDANTQSLNQIWNGEAYFKYRWFTQAARRVLPGCATCTHQMAYPHVVRKVTAQDETIKRWEKEVAP